MSSIVISGDTSGAVTVAAPAVAGTNTLTLPASTGTVILANASNNLQMNSGFGSDATAYGCRAWVNFNGTGTVAIRGSGNVNSLTDNGVGDYTVNFVNSMPDANYSVSGGAGSTIAQLIMSPYSAATLTTTSVRVFISNALTAGDNPLICVSIFR
jgi:hypothetical protein